MYAGDGLYLVADGMGGQPAGDVASKLAIAELSSLTERVPAERTDAAGLSVPALQAGIRRARDRRVDEGHQDPARYGMGTTLAGLALVDDGRWAVLNIGDSRV